MIRAFDDEVLDNAAFGSAEQLRRSLECFPNMLNDSSSSGNTPLGIAAEFGNLGCVVELLKLGADINKYDPDMGGDPPIKLAIDFEHWEIFLYLKNHGADMHAKGFMGISAHDRLASINRVEDT